MSAGKIISSLVTRSVRNGAGDNAPSATNIFKDDPPETGPLAISISPVDDVCWILSEAGAVDEHINSDQIDDIVTFPSGDFLRTRIRVGPVAISGASDGDNLLPSTEELRNYQALLGDMTQAGSETASRRGADGAVTPADTFLTNLG